MNISIIKERVRSKEGKDLKFKFNGSRNQIEEFYGKIISLYPSVFTIEVNNEHRNVKSFSYSDVLTNSLEIKEIDTGL